MSKEAERIEQLERITPKLKANKKFAPIKIEALEWELRALKSEQKNKEYRSALRRQRKLVRRAIKHLVATH